MSMLKAAKESLPKKDANPALHAIRAGRVQKNQKNKSHKAGKGGQGKGKNKMGYAHNNVPFAPKPKTPPPPKKDNPAKDAICHQCGEVGHWRRNCPVYLAELMKKKKLSQEASTSGIFTIELYSFPSKSWIYDTGCGTHICITTQGLRGSKKLKPGALSLYVGDGHRAAVEAIGTYHLELPSGLVIVLNNCHYAPSITRGVISVSRLFDDGFINRFDDNNVISVSKNNLVYFMAVPRDGIFEIDMSCSNTNDSSMYAITNKRAKINLDSSLLWHCRLGHISKKRIKKLQHDGLLNSIDIESLGKCVSCLSGKMARKPYSHQVERAKDLLGLIHTDVCGPFRIVSRQGASYFVTFTDDFSRYGYVYLLKHKHEVFETFKVFQKEVENQLGKTIKSLRSDRGGEYMSQEFLDHLKEHGIIAHRTPPYTPQNNGVSERRNRTLLDMVRSMMSQTTLPKSFWDYALETAARILNMVPTKKVDKTPYEIWHGQAPKLSYLRVWGCEAFVKHDTLTKPDKLDPRSFKCIFIGYPKETMGYSFYSPSENKVFVARNAEFFESKLLDLKASGSVEDLELIQEEDTNPSVDTSLNHEEDDQEIDEPQSDINPIRRSTRTRRPTDRLCLYIDAEEHELGDLGEPANYKAALLDPESKKWLDAMNVEMQSMKDNDVWVLVELPPNARTVGSKWLFKKKTDMDGAVYIFKARLVAKGFTQTYGVDYEETFSPVADIRAIRILIAIAAYYDYEIWQMDVKTAFLNGHLSEEVYMEQPEGFVNPKYPNHVCKLKRSIYGLKQASRQWNKRFDDEIKKFGFTQNPDEPCVYLKASGSYVAILILYVDDILLMGNNIPMLQDVKSYLGRSFAMKDLGDAAYILGIKIYRDRSKRLIGLNQSAYIEKILKRFYMENSKRGTIPMQEKLKLSKSQGASTPAEKQRMQNIPYASAIGSIMYAVRCTRPDVAFAQNMTSRFQQNPGEEHWTAVKNILKYLRNTKDMFLVYGGNLKRQLRVSCYTDAGYLTDADNLKSQTGYVFVLNGGAVDWKSTKQSIFATSSTDAEYIAAFDASKEAVWIRKFISGLGIVPTIEEPISMYCDNTGAIAIAKDDGVTKGARHFRAKVHYLRETIKMGDVRIEKIDTDDNLADPFTKALAFPKHSELTRNIGLLPASSFM
ncbi:retrotransposon protein, putative, ty1-copia subclass [Tanacetum coccineum]